MVIQPTALADALKILNEHDCSILAGGTDVMVKKRAWAGLSPKLPEMTLSLFHIKELDYVFQDSRGLHIGAMTSLENLLHHPLVIEPLKVAIKDMASPAIRYMGTIGGNVGNASPAGDTLPILYVFNSLVVLESVQGTREVPIENFILGPGSTAKQKNELIKEIILEKIDYTGFYYEKVGGRKSDAISKVSFIGIYTRDNGLQHDLPHKQQSISEVRCAFGAVYKTVLRNKALEEGLLHSLNEKLGANNGDENRDENRGMMSEYEAIILPIDDQRSTAVYRKKCALNLLKSFIHEIGGV